jgi:hypothetical protein
MDRLVPLGAEGMSRYCPRTHWLPMLVLEFMTAVGEHCLAVAESRSCRESRSADDVTKGLLHCMRQVAIDESMGMACRLRLADLVLTVLVHAMSRLDPRVGVSVYVKLRSHSGRRPRISHKAMFESLPDDEERARLLNFLYREGEQNPVQYIERFGQYFAAAEHLRFESKEAGFRVKPPG